MTQWSIVTRQIWSTRWEIVWIRHYVLLIIFTDSLHFRNERGVCCITFLVYSCHRYLCIMPPLSLFFCVCNQQCCRPLLWRRRIHSRSLRLVSEWANWSLERQTKKEAMCWLCFILTLFSFFVRAKFSTLALWWEPSLFLLCAWPPLLIALPARAVGPRRIPETCNL